MPVRNQPVYDTIGRGYTVGRVEDPRIAVHIRGALGDAESVLNIGAGSGSYEPRDRKTVAVEPSAVMIQQRPSGAAPAVRASAEGLPFADDAFDATMGVLTLHHWIDRARGLAEMRRVARHRAVLFLRDPTVASHWWLHEYFPATARLVAARQTPLADVAHVLGRLDVRPVPIPADCRDGFEAAYWGRPRAFLDPEVWEAMSALALIPTSDRDAGMAHLAADLASGEWTRRFGTLVDLDELDLGYRVVVARVC